MNIRNAGLALGWTLVAVLAVAATSQNSRSFAPNVNLETGQILVPENYTRWPTLGTWSHAKRKENRAQRNITLFIRNRKQSTITVSMIDILTEQCW